uniref:Bax inhibitor 1 n=1 Tax=Cebus imitator TaxID=2715852 RepID=A0A2K5S5N3_CEBIM
MSHSSVTPNGRGERKLGLGLPSQAHGAAPALLRLVTFGQVRLCCPDSGTMNIFDRKINFDALLKFSHITPSTQQHLKKVYASFALCMFVAAAGAYVHVITHFIQAGLLSALGSLILMIWLMATPHSHETEQKRLGLLAGFAFLTGVGLGPALEFCIAINPSILPTAFMGTAMIFTCFTLSAVYANLYVGLVVMCGFVLFDTQLIIEKAENGDQDYIWHCIDLFLDFVTLFRKLMMILAMNEKDKKKEKK